MLRVKDEAPEIGEESGFGAWTSGISGRFLRYTAFYVSAGSSPSTSASVAQTTIYIYKGGGGGFIDTATVVSPDKISRILTHAFRTQHSRHTFKRSFKYAALSLTQLGFCVNRFSGICKLQRLAWVISMTDGFYNCIGWCHSNQREQSFLIIKLFGIYYTCNTKQWKSCCALILSEIQRVYHALLIYTRINSCPSIINIYRVKHPGYTNL